MESIIQYYGNLTESSNHKVEKKSLKTNIKFPTSIIIEKYFVFCGYNTLRNIIFENKYSD